jgi:hypothetical protein
MHRRDGHTFSEHFSLLVSAVDAPFSGGMIQLYYAATWLSTCAPDPSASHCNFAHLDSKHITYKSSMRTTTSMASAYQVKIP